MIKLTEKDISVLKIVSQIAGIFTIIIALTMIFSFIQLKTINPLDNPALISVKEQYDKDPEVANKAEQVRAMDLMARKAYFASRRQVETGSYLLLTGAIVFLLCQRLIGSTEKINPVIPDQKPDQITSKSRYRKSLLVSASVITVVAIIASFMLRRSLPDLRVTETNLYEQGKPAERASTPKISFNPDKTNFPLFRGQDSHGIAGGSGYVTEWNGEEGKNIKWKTRILKTGKSSPVIWDNKIFITGAEGVSCEVYCINKSSGEILWTASASGIEGEPSGMPETDADAGFAASSAATNGKAVCAIFANGNLLCSDLNGNRIWARNIGTPKSAYGYSSSLTIFENTLIVQFDSNEKLSLMGFDITSGELKWETIRQGRPVWSSPVITTFGNQQQVIINGNPAVAAFDPVTGSQLWAVDCMSGDVAPSVAVNSTMVFAVTDYVKLVAIKPGLNASIVWEDNTYTPDISSPVATDNYLFLSTGTGDVVCYNAETGDTLWTHYFMEQFYASPVIADEMVYFLDRSGTTHIVRAAGEFELVGESPLGEIAECTPAFSDKNIYIRTNNNLYCISKK